MTRHLTRVTTLATESDKLVVTETYEATVLLSSTPVDSDEWTLAGPAAIKATQSTDYRVHFTSALGVCDKLYTSEATGEGESEAYGRLGVATSSYDFHLNIPGFEGGLELSVGDETGCLGSSSRQTAPWPVGPTNLTESGKVSDASSLSGTSMTPTDGGQDTVTWMFTLVP